MSGSITQLAGIEVGHYTDRGAKTGCTVILCKNGVVAGVDVRGSAPGTRETDLLRGYNLVERIHAIMFCGGSAYGLDAASGAMQYLEEKGIGQDVGVGVVPIVPAAVIFDLGVGDARVRPGKAEGYLACKNAGNGPVETGNVGAGTGAMVAKALGIAYAQPGGFGMCCIDLEDGVKVAAAVVVNAMGDIYNPETGAIVRAAKINGELISCMTATGLKGAGLGNTTIGVLATNAKLTREEANKLASMAHDGLALTIRPVHTPFDGDTFFGISTGEKEYPLLPVLVAGVKAVCGAVLNAVGE